MIPKEMVAFLEQIRAEGNDSLGMEVIPGKCGRGGHPARLIMWTLAPGEKRPLAFLFEGSAQLQGFLIRLVKKVIRENDARRAEARARSLINTTPLAKYINELWVSKKAEKEEISSGILAMLERLQAARRKRPGAAPKAAGKK